MSDTLSLAQRYAWDLAKTLMVCVVLYKVGTQYGVLPVNDFEGDPDTILCEYDPFG